MTYRSFWKGASSFPSHPPPRLAPQLHLHIERHVNPLRHLSLGHSATWIAVSNRICSGLVSLTTQRCKPHTHLATCDTAETLIRKESWIPVWWYHPSSQQATINDDYRLPTLDSRLQRERERERLQAFFAYEKLKSVLQALSSRTYICIRSRSVGEGSKESDLKATNVGVRSLSIARSTQTRPETR